MIREAFSGVVVGLLALPLAVHADNGVGHKDHQCIQECRSQMRTCNAAAREEYRMCAQATCSTEAEAVEAACASDPMSETCEEARVALRQCLAPCLEEVKTAMAKCRADARTCVGQCPEATAPPRPDTREPGCVGTCWMGLRGCTANALATADSCAADCQDLVEAARQACADDQGDSEGDTTTSDEACAAARKAAHDCIQPCNGTLRTAISACIGDSQECVGACPPRPTPMPHPTHGMEQP